MEDINEDKKEQILRMAKSIFAKYGYSRTTMDDISKTMGMKKNSLYYYFPSKEAIFEEVIRRESDSCFNDTLKAVDKKKTAPEKVKSFIIFGIHTYRERANLHNLTIQTILDIKQVVETFHQKFVSRQIQFLTEIIEEGIKNNEFKKVNSEEIASYILNFTNAIEFRELYKYKNEFHKEIDFSSVDKKITTLLDLIIEGLKN